MGGRSHRLLAGCFVGEERCRRGEWPVDRRIGAASSTWLLPDRHRERGGSKV
ncbi:hypothetical protein Hanom_Chr11g01030941 [Helianthus anomalus]